MNARTPKLEAFDLTVQFAGVRALDGVSIDVAPGEVVAIIGPNGAGKTTLFNVLTGFVSPTSGRVQLEDQDITTLSPAARTRKGLSRTFQQGGLWLSETAVGNLLIASYLTVDTDSPAGLLGLGRRERQRELDRLAMADDVLAILGLTGYRDVSAADMPYGSRKLLELGCALLTRPAVLLLDEPAAGASREEIPRLSGVVRDIRARLGVTVVVIEHHVPLVREVADRIYVLNFGQVIAAGTPDEVTDDPTVVEAYLGSGGRAPRSLPAAGAAAPARSPPHRTWPVSTDDAVAHLSFHGLRAGYGGIPVVHGVDLELGRGEFGVLLGANGAGKTTTLRAVLGLADVLDGDIRVGGESVRAMSTPDIVRRGVALVPEGRELFSSLPVEDNLASGTLVAGREHRRERLEQVLETFPVLGQRLRQTAGTLSGGEQQMLAIGRALMSDPQLLLVDEASLGLAPIVVETVLDLVSTVNRTGVTVLAVEQNLAVLNHADVACVLEVGAVQMAGRVTDLADRLHGDVAAAYLGRSNAS